VHADGSLAIGLLTVLTLSEIKHELEQSGIKAVDLDFLVTNCGAYIFCRSEETGEFVADGAWERKIPHRWDKKLVVCVLPYCRSLAKY
jgi:hypothetical protein